MVYGLFISGEWRSCVTCRRKHFLRHTTDGTIGHSGGNEQATSGGNRPRSSSNVYGVCKECAVLDFVSCVLSV